MGVLKCLLRDGIDQSRCSACGNICLQNNLVHSLVFVFRTVAFHPCFQFYRQRSLKRRIITSW